MAKSNSTYLYTLAGLVVVGLIGYAIFKPEPPAHLDGFAECLEERGATFYGAWWCPACATQKELFGGSEKKLPYVECSPGRDRRTVSPICRQANIQSYPTWRFADGTEGRGVQSIEALAAKTGCEIPDTPVE